MNLRKFFADDGPLAEVVGDGYRRRCEQVTLATLTMQTLEAGGATLLGDAKTGTGKSFAYLVPAAMSGLRVVVSTATKNLQHQLLVKELPTVCAAMEAAGLEPPTYGLLKGRSNYLCQGRHDAFLKEPRLTNTTTLEQLNAWRNTTATGDLETLRMPKPSFWADIASDSDDCHRKSCEYASECFYFTAKERVQDVDILIVNHHLL
jgi:ATP-dependent DNA helicase DinG